jgi:DNA-binding transcriptional LysR family regulator
LRLTLDQMRIFVAVAEHEHVTRAAKSLNLAQSAASAAVAALELHYRTKLFHRVGRGIVLTEAGRVFLAEAKSVLARAEAAEQAMAELGGLKRGTLHVQASQTIAGYWLPRHLAAFRRAHPDIDVQLSIGNTAQVAAAVRDGIADLGFAEGIVEDSQISAETVAGDSMVLVVGPEHAWAARRRVAPAEFSETEWVLREKGSGTRSVFEAALRQAGFPPENLRIAMELPSNDAVRAAVEAGMGATVISVSVAAPSIETGLLHRVNFELPDRAYYVLRHRERYQTRAAEALMALIHETQKKPAQKRGTGSRTAPARRRGR